MPTILEICATQRRLTCSADSAVIDFDQPVGKSHLAAGNNLLIFR